MTDDRRPAPAGRSVCIETYGCQMNVYDSAAIGGLLAARGWRPVDDPAQADVVLLNTCSVRDHAEHRIISRIGELRHLRAERDGRPHLIGVCGCMAERLAAHLVAARPGADLAVGVDQYDRLPDLLDDLLAGAPVAARTATGHRDDAHYVAPPAAYPENNSHLVTIHKGCDYRCTYCIVPDTRGPQREKAATAILAEIAAIVAAGGTEVTLLGQNVTAWRGEGGADFADLIARVAAVPGLRRIRFLTGHPRDLSDRLLRTLAGLPAVCPWLHVPAQSGSDRILRRMKRLYTRADYLRMVDHARAWIPGVTFSSDFIVGFPGETEADFRETLELVETVGYDQLFAFKYSPRPGTPAARLADDVTEAVKKARLAALLATQAGAWETLARAQVGQVWRVAVEGPARRPPGRSRARTANNRKVVLEAGNPAPGTELTVRITGFTDTTFRGEPVAGPPADETR
ncbi:MAG: tRNA (N6-isopentenyl adenosine(37)-C2)-methylthiotransferase MiaB [Candidatus Krumholzibacteriia bacterium]